MPYFYAIQDNYYVVFVLIPLVISLIIQAKMKMTYRKYEKISSSRGMTGYMAAEMVLKRHRISNVSIEGVHGRLTDHFDPRVNVIRLSPQVYNGTSIAAISIACHEAGHAVQYNENYTPIKLRNTILPVTNIGSSLSFPLILLGLFFSIEPLIFIGIIFFSLVVIFHLVTLPVELNASSRALAAIDSYEMLSSDESKGAKKVLTAAALTYIAAFAASLAQLLRLILIFRDRR
ncbi:MAG TPA: zinc metallopeptidase [Oscillospiraceae bacterium]|nr:zinc metallopeptidase [Oscillospiraceae bacterium]